MDIKVHTANATKATVINVELICTCFSHEDVSTLACTRCVLHSVSNISSLTKRWCEDLDALYRFVTRLSPSTGGRQNLRGSG